MSCYCDHDEDAVVELDVGTRLASDADGIGPRLVSNALQRHRSDDGSLRLRRPDTVSVMHRVQFLAEDAGVELPLGLASALAATLEAEADEGRLDPQSDPLTQLLEPLHAHFGLSVHLDGSHRCQCFAPHDPTANDEVRLLPLRTGHTVQAHLPELAPDPEQRDRPLRIFRERLSFVAGSGSDPCRDLSLLGWLPAARHRPRLWIHGRAEDPGRYDSLPLDDSGQAHLPTLDRRYRTGVRWDRVSCIDARWLCRLDGRARMPALPVTWTIDPDWSNRRSG